MKQIFTLLAIALSSTFSATAQTENFDAGAATLTSNCWRFTTVTDINSSTSNATPISVVSMGTDALGTSNISTPYYDLTGNTTVAFTYKLSQPLNGNSTRTLQVGSTDIAGVFTAVSSATIVFDKNNDPTTTQNFAAITVPATGVKRLTIRTIGSTGDGQCFLIIDDLTITNATYHYAPSTCNTAPTAGNDMFTAFTSLPYSGDVVSGSDFDVNPAETISASMVSQPAATAGSVSMNTNGTFTFTPIVGFLGGTVTFTYRVTDNGYDPLSTTATVTITYPSFAPLPVHLISFNGSISSDKAHLTWLVAGNETGEHFEIERSDDGKSFSTEAYVFTTKKFASESYIYNSSKTLTGQTYYRLKIVNKDGSVDHSRTIVLKTAKAGNNNNLVILQNPVASTLMFHYTSSTTNKSTVNIYNTAGARMLTNSIGFQAGTNAVSINLDGKFNSGTYILEVINGSERTVSKLIKK